MESCGLLRVFGTTCRGWLVVYGILLHGLEMLLPWFMMSTSRVSNEYILMYRKIIKYILMSQKCSRYRKFELLRVKFCNEVEQGKLREGRVIRGANYQDSTVLGFL